MAGVVFADGSGRANKIGRQTIATAWLSGSPGKVVGAECRGGRGFDLGSGCRCADVADASGLGLRL